MDRKEILRALKRAVLWPIGCFGMWLGIKLFQMSDWAYALGWPAEVTYAELEDF